MVVGHHRERLEQHQVGWRVFERPQEKAYGAQLLIGSNVAADAEGDGTMFLLATGPDRVASQQHTLASQVHPVKRLLSLVRMSTGVFRCIEDRIRIGRHDITACIDIFRVDVDDRIWRIGDRFDPPVACIAEPESLRALTLQLGANSSIEDDALFAWRTCPRALGTRGSGTAPWEPSSSCLLDE